MCCSANQSLTILEKEEQTIQMEISTVIVALLLKLGCVEAGGIVTGWFSLGGVALWLQRFKGAAVGILRPKRWADRQRR
jgi:hypothetical protein